MKSRVVVYGLIAAILVLGMVLRESLVDNGRLNSSPASGESVSDAGSITAENQLIETEYRGIDFQSENINQILREYEAREYEALKVTEFEGVQLEYENINQILRDYETLNGLQDERESTEAQTGQEDEQLQRQMRFNLPEGTN